MTMEQFDRAQELYNEKEFVAEVENLLGNWKNGYGQTNDLIMVYGEYSHDSGAICNKVVGCSEELQKRLVETCREYYKELMKAFEEV